MDALTRDRTIGGLKRFWFSGWGFDWVYNKMIIVPYEWIARTNRTDVVDLVYQGIAAGTNGCNALFTKTQTGRVRNYAEGIALGAVIIVAVAVLL